jgi:hypothetical protein
VIESTKSITGIPTCFLSKRYLRVSGGAQGSAPDGKALKQTNCIESQWMRLHYDRFRLSPGFSSPPAHCTSTSFPFLKVIFMSG